MAARELEHTMYIYLHFVILIINNKRNYNQLGVVNGPLKNETSRQILPKSRNLAQPINGSRSLRFCVCRSHICFSIKSLQVFILDLDFKMPVLASRRVSDLAFATPSNV